MTIAWHRSTWVTEHQKRIGIGLQVSPNDIDSKPAQHLLEAGRRAEALEFDAFFISDHP